MEFAFAISSHQKINILICMFIGIEMHLAIVHFRERQPDKISVSNNLVVFWRFFGGATTEEERNKA